MANSEGQQPWDNAQKQSPDNRRFVLLTAADSADTMNTAQVLDYFWAWWANCQTSSSDLSKNKQDGMCSTVSLGKTRPSIFWSILPLESEWVDYQNLLYGNSH